MLRLRRLLFPGVPGLVAAGAVEATRRLAALLAEEGGVQSPAALRAGGAADSGHGPPPLRRSGRRARALGPSTPHHQKKKSIFPWEGVGGATHLGKLGEAARAARRCRRIVWFNFAGTLAVDSLGMGLAAVGLLN